MQFSFKKSEFIKTKISSKKRRKDFSKKTYFKKFLKTLRKTTALRRFRTLLLRSTSARQTHINTTEMNYCLLKTRARRITKCLRNHKHPIAIEQSLHLGESREVTREPHAKGDAGSKGREKKRPPPFSRFRCTLARPLAINMLLIMTPVNASQN